MEIDVKAVYTLDGAFYAIERGECDVQGATVVLDALTNDVRGTRSLPPATPQQLVHRVDRLRRYLMRVVVCQLKPMEIIDVTAFNCQLNDYLRREKLAGRHGFGCRTQIRLEFLRNHGFHVWPEYDSLIDHSYACAFLGIPVPNPTPWDAFVPQSVRQRWETEWPRLIGRQPTGQDGW